MRALIFDGQTARLDSAQPAPVAQPGEAIIRLVKGAVSAIDLEICRGLLNYRGVLGREFVGVVESINEQRSEGKGQKSEGRGQTADSRQPKAASLLNKRVVGSIVTSCGVCDMCVAGLRNHCRERTIMGLHGRGGCLAERFTLPLKNLVAVPDSVDNDHAVFACELASALQAAQQLTIVGKPYITILGDGALGLLTVQVMSKLNASVRLVGQHAEKLAVCEKWGVKHRHVNDVGRRADQDIVVDCTGTAEGFELALQLVRPRGKIVMKSLTAPMNSPSNMQSPPSTLASSHGDHKRSPSQLVASHPSLKSIDLTPLVLNEIELIGSHAGPMSEAIAMLARQEIDVVSLISRRMNLNDGPLILKSAAQPDTIKVLVEA